MRESKNLTQDDIAKATGFAQPYIFRIENGHTVPRAYVVITAEPGKAREIARQIASLPGVKMADACWGSRDVFAVIEVRDSPQRLEGVRETNTHIAID